VAGNIARYTVETSASCSRLNLIVAAGDRATDLGG